MMVKASDSQFYSYRLESHHLSSIHGVVPVQIISLASHNNGRKKIREL